MTEETDHKFIRAYDLSGCREGHAVDLTPDNHAIGVLMFGAHWPRIRRILISGKGERYMCSVRCTSVTEQQRKKGTRSVGGLHFQETTFDRCTGKVRTRFL